MWYVLFAIGVLVGFVALEWYKDRLERRRETWAREKWAQAREKEREAEREQLNWENDRRLEFLETSERIRSKHARDFHLDRERHMREILEMQAELGKEDWQR